MKKKTLVIILVSAILVSMSLPFTLSVDAKEQQNRFKLKNFYITIPYNQIEEKIVKKEEPNSARIEVVSKQTGEVIRAYGEIVEDIVGSEYSIFNILLAGTYQLITVYEERTDYVCTSRLSTQMIVYTNGSFRQINEVTDTWWSPVSSGPWYLINTQSNSISRTGSFPTSSIETEGSAVIEVKTSSSIGGDFSISALGIAGFSFDRQIGLDWYFRKPTSIEYVYSLY